MSTANQSFVEVQVPSRVAELAFTYEKPKDFVVLDLPAEQPDFQDPNKFLGLHVSMAPYGAVVFAAAARPAHSDGTVEDWLRFHVGNEGTEIVACGAGLIGDLRAVIAEGIQQTESGTMRMRIAMLEDGGRLVNVTVMGPDAIWDSVQMMLRRSMESVRFETVKGQTTPVMKGEV